MLTRYDIREILTKLHIDLKGNNQDLSEAEDFLYAFFCGNNNQRKIYTKDEAFQFLKRAKNASILIQPDLKANSLIVITRNIKAVNEKTLDQLYQIHSRIYGSYYNDDHSQISKNTKVKETKGLSRKIQEWMNKVCSESDSIYEQLTDENLDKLTDISILYRMLKPYLPQSDIDEAKKVVVRHTDLVIDRILSKKFLESFTPRTTEEVLKVLTSEELGENKLTDKELASAIKRASSILNYSNQEKIKSCIETIDKYKEYLLNIADDDELFIEEINKNVNFKNLLSRSATIINNATFANEANYHLLLGDTVYSTFNHVGKQAFPGVEIDDIKKYGKIKINLDKYDLYHLLTHNTSHVLSNLSTNKMIQFSKDFEEALDLVFSIKTKGTRLNRDNFKIDKYLTRRNLIQLISNSDIDQTFVPYLAANIVTLNKVMRDTEVFKVMQNNISLFMQDPSKIQADIDSLIKKYKNDLPKLSLAVNQYVNGKFITEIKHQTKTKGTKSTIDDENENLDESIDFVDDGSFTVIVDGGIYEKPKTFSEEIKNYSIGECIASALQIVDRIKENLETKEMLSFDYDITQARLDVMHIQKLIEKAEQLLNERYNPTSNDAISFRKTLNKLKLNTLQKLYDDCVFYANIISGYTSYPKRGKANHVKANKPNSVNEHLNTLFESLSKIDYEPARELFIEQRKEAFCKLKERIIEENREANLERLAKNEEFINFNGYYEYCSIISDLINRKILNPDEIKLEK